MAWMRGGIGVALATLALVGMALSHELVHLAKAPPGAAPGGDFSLVDHTGRPVTEKDFLGNFLVVFFGYTYCPDVCPTTLNDVAIALDLLGDGSKRVQPLFISVDPKRDTPDVLADYVRAFDARIVGLTGTQAQTRAVAKAYRVSFAKARAAGGEGDSDYTVDHSAFVYFMGPDGTYLNHFAFGASPETMAEEMRRYIDAEK